VPTAMSLDRAIARSGHTEHQLRLAIALGTTTDAAIIRQFGLGNKTNLAKFIEVNADEIAEIGEKLREKNPVGLSGLWAAKKNLRIAELQKDVEDINHTIEYYREDDEDGRVIPEFGRHKDYVALLNTKTMILRSIADEIDGTRRAQTIPEDERQIVRYVINTGEDTGGLK
jgi:hypothetical protein